MSDKPDAERVIAYISAQAMAIANNYETIKGLLDIAAKANDSSKDILIHMSAMEKKIDCQFKRLDRRLERLEDQFEEHRERKKH